MKEIKILEDFSESPGPRYCWQGPDSGEAFYHDVLNNAFAEAYKHKEKLIIDLDNTDGYMSSFLDEAIGNLVYDFGSDMVSNYLEIVSREEPSWINVIKNRIIPEWEKRRKEGKMPKKTDKAKHKAWFRLIKGDLKNKKWYDIK